jgi:predicted nucleotidyltransferase
MRNTEDISFAEIDDHVNVGLLEKLEAFFEGIPGVALVYLFGSVAAGHSHKDSDVDIGVVFKDPPPIDSINDLRDKLNALLGREVDLISLNRASPILKMQVLKNGRLIYMVDEKPFHQFFVDTVNQYHDLKIIRKRCEESILKGRLYA